MPSPLKIFIHNSLVMVTSRTEEGLPLVPTEFMNEIIWSTLATAQAKYPVELVKFMFQANHLHLIIYVDDPEAVSLFVGYVKQEIAHRINRLLGKRKHTIWAEGYDSPIILDPKKALEAIAYVALNPLKDHVIESIEQYPGVSSNSMFQNECFTRECFYIPRDEIPTLKNSSHPWRETQVIMDHLKVVEERPNTTKYTLTLSPYAWKKCFSETKDLPDEKIRELMISSIQERKQEVLDERIETNRRSFPAPIELIRQSMVGVYQPKSFGKRMYCLAADPKTRIRFLHFVRRLIAKAKEVFADWIRGIFDDPFPPGLYPPGRRPMASILSW